MARAIAVKDVSKFGRKRHCGGCGARFYDFKQEKVHCPKCGADPADEPPPFKIEDHISVEEEEPASKLGNDEEMDESVDMSDEEDLLGASDSDDDDLGDDDLGDDDSEEEAP